VDYGNNRVLEYAPPFANHMAASRVFGQPDFKSYLPNNGGVSASSLSEPFALALDYPGNLYVADSVNHRVLEYDGILSRVFLPLVKR
jgi:hypothetical protein